MSPAIQLAPDGEIQTPTPHHLPVDQGRRTPPAIGQPRQRVLLLRFPIRRKGDVGPEAPESTSKVTEKIAVPAAPGETKAATPDIHAADCLTTINQPKWCYFPNGILNRPLAFEGSARTERANECAITSEGRAPTVLVIQLLAYLTAMAHVVQRYAQEAGRAEFEWGIPISFNSLADLLRLLGRPASGTPALHDALHFLLHAEVAGFEISQLIRIERDPAHREFTIVVNKQWLRACTPSGKALMRLAELFQFREHSHLNAYAWIQAWRRPIDEDRRSYYRIEKYCHWFGLRRDRVDKAVQPLREAVKAVNGVIEGGTYVVDVVSENRKLYAAICTPNAPREHDALGDPVKRARKKLRQ